MLLEIMIVVLLIVLVLFGLYIFQNEKWRRDYHQKMEEVEKEKEKTLQMQRNFMANMSHELRTPIHAVSGLTELLGNVTLDPNTETTIKLIRHSLQHLESVIGDVLEYSCMGEENQEIEQTEYSTMVMLQNAGDYAASISREKDIYVNLEIDSEFPRTLGGDERKIWRVMMSLLDNAVKFTETGCIDIQFHLISKQDDEAQVQLEVRDSGIGMSKEQIDRIFDEFQRADTTAVAEHGGLGLGLAIAKKLVGQLGGTIGVNSAVGIGSTFSIRLTQHIVEDAAAVTPEAYKGVKVEACFCTERMAAAFEQTMRQLGTDYHRVDQIDDLIALPDDANTYLFIEYMENDWDILRLTERKEQSSSIIIANLSEQVSEQLNEKKIIRAPFSPLLFFTIFDGVNLATVMKHQNVKEEEPFIAPDARALIVDDNQINLNVAAGMLKPFAVQTDCVDSGMAAIEAVKEKEYDLVFMDYMMPEMDGIETTKLIKSLDIPYVKELPVIVLTANAVGKSEQFFLENGMDDFLAKPVRMNQMAGVLRKWLPQEKLQKWEEQPQDLEQEEGGFPEIPSLNMEHAAEYTVTPDAFWETLSVFVHTVPNKSEMIRAYSAEEKWKSYQIEVHALKSAAKIIGADALSDFAKKMEDASAQLNDALEAGSESEQELSVWKAQLVKETEALLLMYMDVYQELLPYIEERDAKAELERQEKKADAKQMPLEEQILLFDRLRQSIEDFDLDASEDYIGQLDNVKMHSDDQEIFQNILNQMEDLDYDEALQSTCRCIVAMSDRLLSAAG
jgi:signal transduction histidine kinase/CheY-like chemotaxis protein/HPt (histidine-containing phosphotransfer) domain-containing protein